MGNDFIRPEIRFQSDELNWEEYKIGEIFKVTRGQVLATSKTSQAKSDKNPYPVYSSQTKNDGLMGYYNKYLFDTAITWTTDGANAGTVNFREGKFYSTNVNGVLLSEKGYANKAVAEALNLVAWKYVSKVGNPKLMNNVMGEITIALPKTIEQQEEIGNFFGEIDNIITLHQQELDTLKQTKQGLMQKMFPKEGKSVPEIRFSGFTGEWEQIRLGDKAIIKGRLGWKSLKQVEYITEGPAMIAGRHINGGKINWGAVDHIPQWRYDESPEIMLENGDIIFSKDGSLGNPALISNLDFPATINSTMMLVRVNETIDSSFFYQVMCSDRFERLIYIKVSGSSIPHLFQADMNEFSFVAPDKEEQIMIGNFFKQLDEVIALHQQELDALKQTKKAFLQKMFV